MSSPKHLFRRTGYGCEKSPTGKHAAEIASRLIVSLRSKCIYCASQIEREKPQSKSWRLAA